MSERSPGAVLDGIARLELLRGVATYRLRLEREDNDAVLYQWGRIPEERVRPLLDALKQYVPLFTVVARAKLSLIEVYDEIINKTFGGRG